MAVSPQAAAPAPVGVGVGAGADRREAGIQPAGKAASADPGAGGGSASLETGAATDRPRQSRPANREWERVLRRRSNGLSVTRGRVEKGTNKPKRPPSAFLLFMQGFRKDYKIPHVQVSTPMAIKAGRDKWMTMTDYDKAPHIAEAKKLQIEYNKKMDTYNKSQALYATKAKKLNTGYKSNSESNEEGNGGESDEEDDGGESNGEDDGGESNEEDDSGGSSLSGKKGKAEKGPNKPKRPPSAFFLFVEEFRKEYMKENPSVNFEPRYRQAGATVWHSMTEDEQAPHFKKAQNLMGQYKEKIKVYNSRQEAQPRPSTHEKSKSQSGLQAGGLEVLDHADKSKSQSGLQAEGLELPGDTDKSKSLHTRVSEPPADSSKSKSKNQLQPEGSKRYLQAGGLEVPGDTDKSKSLQPRGSDAPDKSKKSKSKNQLQPEGPDDGSILRPRHPKETSVIRGNDCRRRQHRGLPFKWFGAARKIKKIAGCRSVPLSS